MVTLAFSGVEAVRVDVQVQFTRGESKFFLVGMGDKAVSESRERVRAAFVGMGLALPAKRIIANLAPADLPKEGSHYDLPIALAIMAAMGIIPPDVLEDWAAVGNLSFSELAKERTSVNTLPTPLNMRFDCSCSVSEPKNRLYTTIQIMAIKANFNRLLIIVIGDFVVI